MFRFRIIRPRVRRRKSTQEATLRYKTHKEVARALVAERLLHFNQFYQCTIGRISIRDQRTRWGSCSRKGNLNFNYRLATIAPHLADYVIVHELCHLIEFNHGEAFWELVARTIPEHADMRAELRNIRLS